MKLAVTEIEAMDREALIPNLNEVFGTLVPKRLSSPFLRRFLAFEMQGRESSGLPKGCVGKLAKAAREDGPVLNPVLKPGGHLIREWNAVTYAVDVVDGGFLWREQRFATLSPIAWAITGARWSGPPFFGLKRTT